MAEWRISLVIEDPDEELCKAGDDQWMKEYIRDLVRTDLSVATAKATMSEPDNYVVMSVTVTRDEWMEMAKEKGIERLFAEYAHLFMLHLFYSDTIENPDNYIDLPFTGDDNEDAWNAIEAHPDFERANERFEKLASDEGHEGYTLKAQEQ